MHDDELELGYVAGVHGVHGALRIKLHNAASDALRPDAQLHLAREGKTEVRARITSAAEVPGKRGLYRVRLEQVSGREAAEALKGCTVFIARTQLPGLEAGEFYLADAIGLPVERAAAPQHLGVIVGLTSNGVQDLFDVEWTDDDGHVHRWLLPMVDALVLEVDAQRVLADLPEGFLPDALELPT